MNRTRSFAGRKLKKSFLPVLLAFLTSARCNPRIVVVCALFLVSCNPAKTKQSVECIAPANAGGGWDLTCRTVGRTLGNLGLVDGSVRTINMPGAGGGIGFVHTVTQRNSDANLIVAASPSTTLNLAQRLYGSLTADDVRWVAAVAAEYGALAVAADSPWQTLDDMVAAWRADPGNVIVSGGSAVASQDHMKVLLLAREVGVDPRAVRYVPFDGGGEALTTLLGGFVHLFSGDASEIIGHMEAGTVRMLAVFADERLPGALSTVPTAKEFGYDVTWVTWRGFYAPLNIPDSVYENWVATFDALLGSEEWATQRARAGLEPFGLTGAAFKEFVDEQVDTFGGLAATLGLRQ